MRLPLIDQGLLITPVRHVLQVQVLRCLEGEPDGQVARVGQRQVHHRGAGIHCGGAEEQLEGLQLPHQTLLLIDADGILKHPLFLRHLALIKLIDSIHLELGPHHGLWLQGGRLSPKVSNLDVGVLHQRAQREGHAFAAGFFSPFSFWCDCHLINELPAARRMELDVKRRCASTCYRAHSMAHHQRLRRNCCSLRILANELQGNLIPDQQLGGVQNHHLAQLRLAGLGGAQVQAVGLQGQRRAFAMPHELKDVRRLFRRRGYIEKRTQWAFHKVVRVLDAAGCAVHGGGENSLAGRAEVCDDAGRFRRCQPTRRLGKPEGGAEAAWDSALIRNRNFRDILHGADHCGGNARARRREGHVQLAIAEGELRLPCPCRHSNDLWLALVVIHHDLEVGHVRCLVPCFRRRKLEDDQMKLMRQNDALCWPRAKGCLFCQIHSISFTSCRRWKDLVAQWHIPRICHHNHLVRSLARGTGSESNICL
mmetsp:Transcript_101399/g.241824  ORF Transcript_101399/g.241824 Transcript_101399/m.241824 type:complete len:480 (-) Transcript_101399:2051-3490(-)